MSNQYQAQKKTSDEVTAKCVLNVKAAETAFSAGLRGALKSSFSALGGDVIGAFEAAEAVGKVTMAGVIGAVEARIVRRNSEEPVASLWANPLSIYRMPDDSTVPTQSDQPFTPVAPPLDLDQPPLRYLMPDGTLSTTPPTFVNAQPDLYNLRIMYLMPDGTLSSTPLNSSGKVLIFTPRNLGEPDASALSETDTPTPPEPEPPASNVLNFPSRKPSTPVQALAELNAMYAPRKLQPKPSPDQVLDKLYKKYSPLEPTPPAGKVLNYPSKPKLSKPDLALEELYEIYTPKKTKPQKTKPDEILAGLYEQYSPKKQGGRTNLEGAA